ncbi:MAG: aminopeptidase [Candidatus Izimaplasma sp.]|nr:aminopeptidase [Candidatus Izimaplasma bacterium]
MPKELLVDKLANLSVKIGANVQENQVVVVNGSTESKEIVRKVVEEAYKAGAKKVITNWRDDYTSKYGIQYQTVETLTDIPEYLIDKFKYFVDKDACVISVVSPIPGLNKGLDPVKLQKAGIASSKALSFYREHMMGNRSQWTIIAASNPIWAKKIFPDLEEDEAVEKLWEAIFKASRVTEDNDPIKEWKEHNARLLKHNKILNDYQFESLHFKNDLGTDLTIQLVENHVWSGGQEKATSGVIFNPNIPTEENFTMPLKTGVNGKVVATKPLDYQGNLIEDFWLEFKDGKVVDYDAKENKKTLENLLNFDEGSRYLGEVALIAYDSPINNAGILFFNTLFDENASCHLALGRAYPMNIQGGTEMTKEELEKRGYNDSMSHSDFMFGSKDLDIVGTTKDGKKVQIFKNGNFVI